ncbi:2-succinyl-5-enolpyruvyl-6-hydroxy-3-cyclohexene-1-carboxylate synthase [Cnuibacter physcomitrellae]|uniref:2-succinyl-5-enolpyruvyl-6-hydroxy-3-cyclohexene-1-carboxylate synthase n=1 Tax=Cnuibacter physcomitrellae TaxID=1619308 RepID=A0A1X9LGX8_9MICO|nr:2-succinyl-5-enolpyruvyl-6-hydroxy-3-cyclohexene-1-carboxylic-acid synthase [Cnuibacter physcomitrellae]ARJ04403.1 2-succinyl-5-enolpyruvyl-6-hydroxy-3-cyclohexene-1-carboxylic-acid synthase [Cnuibacter physcomitrellae]GGI40964.1 2-succinyl-5-enolpyruvyl-6-hydroxy-3-cyclohexene-1-carboxylate synthase [Cnuibacter physcomitrellae]
MSVPSPAATFAARLVDELSRLGVRHAVVAPGSRSQALALALADLEARGGITVHVRIDERDAGFLALGLAVESGVPALVVTTSGTAVANLLPAVAEASHSGVPMIVLSADRPAALRGTGSNQTTWQPGMFGRFVRLEHDVAAPDASGMPDPVALAAAAHAAATGTTGADGTVGATGTDPGPVHLNLQFSEPLSGELLSDLPVRPALASSSPRASAARPAVEVRSSLHLARGPRTVVIAGHGAGEGAAALAASAGWPLLAEVSSGSRFGPDLVVAYRELLSDAEFGGRVERAVVFGHPTLSRQVPALLARPDVEVVVVRGAGEPVVPRPDAVVVDALDADPFDRSDREARAWLGSWVFASRALVDAADDDIASVGEVEAGTWDLADRRDYAKGELAALRAPITRRTLGLAVWRASWPHDRLLLGASRLIRELDAAAPGKRIPVHANRGLAGIDGTVSTAMGIAVASQSADARGVGVTRVLLGDLALLHDAGGLLVPRGERRPRVQVIVGNDGGGTIFDGLEVAASADPGAFDRLMYTPHDVDLASLAAAYGWQHQRVPGRGALDQALASPPPGLSLLEVPLSR